MARGWESKSVEEQQAELAANRQPPRVQPTPAQLVQAKEREGLLLARAHISKQLESARNPNHRKVLEGALAELDTKLAGLA